MPASPRAARFAHAARARSIAAPALAFAFVLAPLAARAATEAGTSSEAVAAAPADGAALDSLAARIIAAARADHRAYDRLAWLSDRIGPRLSGSPGAAAAVAWAVEEFKKDGFANARTEKVMVPHWERGVETVSLLAPVARPLVATALGMSVPTPPEGIEGEVVEADSFDALHALGDRVRGRIVLFNKATWADREGAGYRATSPLRTGGPSEAAKQGAVAMLVRTLGSLDARLPHTGTLVYDAAAPKIPAAALSQEDADRIHRLLAAGDTVRARIVLGCRTLPDAESANVVADLRGSARPDEVVVIGGHLDSWDLGDGAIDDGAGVIIAMEALRLLRGLDAPPKRTIRAVLYMNEENGVRGGKTYALDEKGVLAKHVAAIEADSGAGAPYGFRVGGGAGAEAIVRDLAARLAPIGATEIATTEEGGTDIGPLRAAGVPVLGLRQDSTRYFDWHHSAADTVDKVDPALLADNVAAMAFMARALADLETPLPRPAPLPPEERAAPAGPAKSPGPKPHRS